MYVSQEKFEAIVKAAVADKAKVLEVNVTEYGVKLKFDAKRVPYWVSAYYDWQNDSWTGSGEYPGGMTLQRIVNEISRMIQASQR